jgi:hypothetical protein
MNDKTDSVASLVYWKSGVSVDEAQIPAQSFKAR